jgi:stearoyl-CoA desaturase (delta-9 desaturase)
MSAVPVTAGSATHHRVAPAIHAPGMLASGRPLNFEWAAFTPFLILHLLPLAAFWTGVTWQGVVCCAVLYVARMFGVTGAYHRYFSHRTFKTSRVMQFFLAFLAESSSQRGVLWWAAHHRHHHKYSDMPQDIHSPVQDSFWYAHFGWIYNHNSETRMDAVRDLAKYPELRFLDRFWLLPPVVLGVAVVLTLGWSGFLIGFCLSTVLVWHGTFFINSLTHIWGSRRYETTDDSRNNFVTALITMGEGWHNNHHHYMHCARQGFFWWEIDVTYYILKAMSWLGLVWDIREPPAKILNPNAAA